MALTAHTQFALSRNGPVSQGTDGPEPHLPELHPRGARAGGSLGGALTGGGSQVVSWKAEQQQVGAGGRRASPQRSPPPWAVSSCPHSPFCRLVRGSRRVLCVQKDAPTPRAFQFTGRPTRDRREPPEKGPGSPPPTPHSSLASQNNHLSSRLCSNTFPGPPAKNAGFVLARAGLSSDVWALEATVLKKRPFSLATGAGVSLLSGGGDCGVQTWPHPSRGVPGSSDPSYQWARPLVGNPGSQKAQTFHILGSGHRLGGQRRACGEGRGSGPAAALTSGMSPGRFRPRNEGGRGPASLVWRPHGLP